jgi:hypothetical protein
MVPLGADLLALWLALACASCATRSAAAEPLSPVGVRELSISSGFVEPEDMAFSRAAPPREGGTPAEGFRINVPMLRAWVGQHPRSAVEVEFTYIGPSAALAPLASGEVRRQIGVELRARDGCNLLYVMWRIEPTQQLVVSLKSNPGQQRHSECGDRGYLTLDPDATDALPAVIAGEPHVLRANLSGETLEVFVDGRSRWRGRLPEAAASLQGPVGLRSDNARFDVRLRAGSPDP